MNLTINNKELLKKIKKSDKNAINELYDIYSHKLYKFAFSYLKTEEDARDVVQNVFINLWNKRKSLNNDSNLDAYIYTITKNSVISIFRKKAQEKTYLEHLRHTAVNFSNNTDEQYDYNILLKRIQGLIEKLPEKRKHIFNMSREQGLTNKEIAGKLNISVKTVEDHKLKAKRFIRKNLEDLGFIAMMMFEVFL